MKDVGAIFRAIFTIDYLKSRDMLIIELGMMRLSVSRALEESQRLEAQVAREISMADFWADEHRKVSEELEALRKEKPCGSDEDGVYSKWKEELDAVGADTPELGALNPMIAEALAEGRDATGLCTVREAASALIESGRRELEMTWGTPDGWRVNVELKVTRCIDLLGRSAIATAMSRSVPVIAS